MAWARWAHLTLAIGFLLTVAPLTIGQQPITGFTPSLGGPETAVTISGTDFDTPASDRVVFNASVARAETTSPSPTIIGGPIAIETPAGHTVNSSDFSGPPAPHTKGRQGEDGEAEPDPDAGPLMTAFVAMVAVLASAVGLHVILLMYGWGLAPQNWRAIKSTSASSRMPDTKTLVDERTPRPRARQAESIETVMMLKRCFEAQYRSLQPELRALLKRHDPAGLPFITNRVPAGICARVTVLWWTDDVRLRKEQRTFMTVKEDVFLPSVSSEGAQRAGKHQGVLISKAPRVLRALLLGGARSRSA